MRDRSAREPALERLFAEELAHVISRYPVHPLNVLSKAAAEECERRGWSVKQADGRWIPTSKGLVASAAHRRRGGPLS